MLTFLAMSSCSQDSNMAKLLERIPENADVVAVGNMKTIIESAGGTIEGSKINLPSYIKDELDNSSYEKLAEFNSFLKESGLNPELGALVTEYDKSYPIIIFPVSDTKKFTNALEDNGYREKSADSGMSFFSKKVYEASYGDGKYDDYSYIVVKDSYAYYIENVWVGSDFKPLREVERLIDKASESSYAKTAYSKYLVSGNAGGVSFRIPRELRKQLRDAGMPSSIVDMYEGVICVKGNLEKDAITLESKWFDENGKPKQLKNTGKILDLNAKIDPEALKYFNNNESLIAAVSLKGIDWDSYMDFVAEVGSLSRSEKAAMTMVKSYLEKIDGTIALGFGITNGLESIFDLELSNDVFSQFSFTIVVGTKDGKAKGVINDLKGLMDAAGMDYDGNSKGFSMDIPRENATIYVEATDNHIVMSNNKIRKSGDNKVVKSFDFDKYIAASAFYMDRNNKMLRDLKVDNDIKVSFASNGENFESVMRIEVDGGASEGIIAKITKIVLDIANQEKSLENKWREHRDEVRGYNSYYDFDDPYEVVEEAVEVWEGDTVVEEVAEPIEW